ncbi:MAG: hypothetical protein A2W80_04600 [Candidatus Riflebacteria bacterium GWC2_50_8]|nr:MAG: hypothetical protein A2W80_04600 [Candidatus Riflebacteria bacterium GWC2_50_8]
MKLCNKVNEFLEKDPPPDLTKIPVSLSEHINSCPDCRQLVTYFRDLPRDKGFRSLSASETGEFMKTFQKSALAESQRPDSRNITKMSTPFWLNLKWAFALIAFILVLFLGSSRLFRQTPISLPPEVHSFAVLNGAATILSADGKGESIALASEQSLTQETEIKFTTSSKPVELKYQNGGKVFLTGIGQMKVLKDGLNVETGKFNAKFKNLAGVMKVRVPCAVLAIRGTEIQFDIQPATADILLVEGAADLIPDDTSLQAIRLETGKRVVLANNIWTSSKPESQSIPDGNSSGHLATDSQPQPAVAGSESSALHDQKGAEDAPALEIIPDSSTEPDNAPTEETEPASSAEETEEEPDFIGREGFYD